MNLKKGIKNVNGEVDPNLKPLALEANTLNTLFLSPPT
jgi:hypothetical protein